MQVRAAKCRVMAIARLVEGGGLFSLLCPMEMVYFFPWGNFRRIFTLNFLSFYFLGVVLQLLTFGLTHQPKFL